MDKNLAKGNISSLLSIIMPAYNVQNFIIESINSVLNQSHKNFELLIYDDFSSDNTIESIIKIKDSRIKLFKGDKNIGVSAARNFLLNKSKGEYISFLDSDDLCMKDKYKICINYLYNNKDIDLIGSRSSVIDEDSKKVRLAKSFESFTYQDIVADLLFNNTFSTSTIIFKRKILRHIKFENNFSGVEDYLLWTKIINNIKARNLNVKLTKYRINLNGLTSSTKSSIRDETLNFIHSRSLSALGIKATEKTLRTHRYDIDHNLIDANYLHASKGHYNNIVESNNNKKIYNRKSLKKAIRKNWFLKCLYGTKSIGLDSLFIYIYKFKYHSFSSISYFIYLLFYFALKKIKK